MLYQIKCVLSDIKNQWIKMLLVFVQLLVALCLLCYIIQTINNFKLFKEQMTKLTESSMYVFSDRTEDFRFNQMVNEKLFINKMIELNDYIDRELVLTRYIVDNSCSIIFDNNYKMPPDSIEQGSTKQNKIQTLRITENFISTFDLSGDFDLNSVTKTFAKYKETSSEIPIILGNNFKKYYKIGDTLSDSRQRLYKVYGFFNKNSFYIAPDRINSMVYLDNYIVMPCCITKDTNEIMAAVQFLSSYYITDHKSYMYKIIEKTNDLNLFSLRLYTFKEQCKNIEAETIEKILFHSALLSILLTFSLIGLIGNLIQFISDSTKEFAIHLLCGASESVILLRIGIQIGLIIGLSNIIPFIIFGLNKSTIITLLFSIILGALILLYPMVKINLQSIILMIRRNAE